jgi:endonuclease-8
MVTKLSRIVRNDAEIKMPEGHTIHRAARDHHKALAGQKLTIQSPQGRFAEGARQLTGEICTAVEAFGKHLIYRFDTGNSLHVHLGLFGKIRKNTLPLEQTKGAVRVRLISKSHFIDINGPSICEVLATEELKRLIDRVGPDVLRSDADPDLAYEKIRKSNSSIGSLIMNQSVMAGIGNIYRTEILWRQAVHPETPGKMIDKQTFDRIWNDAKALLTLGVKHNAIITKEGASKSQGKYRECVNIFAMESCPVCKDEICRLEINGRRAFVCQNCQPLPF